MSLALTTIAPEAEAVVRWRSSGNTCQPRFVEPAQELHYSPFFGLIVEDISGVSGDQSGLSVVCPIPTGSPFVDVTDADGRLLDVVSVRMEALGGLEDYLGFLMAHDIDSDDWCECDSDTRSGGAGFFRMNLEFAGDSAFQGCTNSCLGGAVPSGWVLDVEMLMEDVNSGGTNKFVVKYLSAQDT